MTGLRVPLCLMRKPATHIISDPDEVTGMGVCAHCGPVRIYHKKSPQGRIYWRCREKRKDEYAARGSRKPWRGPKVLGRTSYRKRNRIRALAGVTSCSRCKFIAEDLCQLEVDHIVPQWEGGTHDLSNLQVLCANCHALKTKSDTERFYRSQNSTEPRRVTCDLGTGRQLGLTTSAGLGQ